ncbi:8317_t:CDS:2, partial [Gigaspora rosea]
FKEYLDNKDRLIDKLANLNLIENSKSSLMDLYIQEHSLLYSWKRVGKTLLSTRSLWQTERNRQNAGLFPRKYSLVMIPFQISDEGW